MTPRPTASILPALLGFGFIAAWAALSLLTALACLLGAAVFHFGALILRGETSIADLRERAEAARSGFLSPDGP